jgi:hypothetical protein
MEILLLIAIIAVGASGLFVAFTFNERTQRNFAPLIASAAENISQEIDQKIAATREQLVKLIQAATYEARQNTDLVRRLGADGRELRQQVRAHAGELRDIREPLRRLEAGSDALRQQGKAQAEESRDNTEILRRLETADLELRQQIQAITDEARRNVELVKQFSERVAAQQHQFSGHLARMDHRVAEFSDSLADQAARISGIYRYVIRRERSVGSPADNETLLLAMYEAESYVNDKGWSGRPYLYALTEQASTMTSNGEPEAGMQGSRADALELVDQEWLPSDGDLMGSLAAIQWPADVVGCVLVAELGALPPVAAEDLRLNLGAAGHWADPHPDSRAARLVVGVRRDGEHKCGLRIHGESGMQVRVDVAGDLINALLQTF